MPKINTELETVHGSKGTVYMTESGSVKELARVINIEITTTFNKDNVKPIGATEVYKKVRDTESAGTMEIYTGDENWARYAQSFTETGVLPPLSIQVTNDDKSSEAGTQTITVYNVIPDSVVIAKLDSGTAALTQSLPFTCNRPKVIKAFNS